MRAQVPLSFFKSNKYPKGKKFHGYIFPSNLHEQDFPYTERMCTALGVINKNHNIQGDADVTITKTFISIKSSLGACGGRGGVWVAIKELKSEFRK